MKFSFTYQELTEIVAETALKDFEDENIAFSLFPMEDGIGIVVEKFKFSILNLKGKILLRFESYQNNELIVSVKFKNIFFEIIKKVLFVLLFNILKRNTMVEEGEVDIWKYIHVATSDISVQLNPLLVALKVPAIVQNINKEMGALEITFRFNPAVLEDEEDLPIEDTSLLTQ